jgi:hypothetical protein
MGPYSSDFVWAEPSDVEAAEAMRWVHENADEARALGATARVSAEATLSLWSAGKRFARRLEEIRVSKTVKLDSGSADDAVSKDRCSSSSSVQESINAVEGSSSLREGASSRSTQP